LRLKGRISVHERECYTDTLNLSGNGLGGA
jgi:hypothetical protein